MQSCNADFANSWGKLHKDGDVDIPISLDLNSSGDIEYSQCLCRKKKRHLGVHFFRSIGLENEQISGPEKSLRLFSVPLPPKPGFFILLLIIVIITIINENVRSNNN